MRRAQLITPYPLEDITVLGITTTLKPHKLAWLVNQTTSLRLAQVADKEADTSERPKDYIHYFKFKTEYCTFNLVKNGVGSYEGTTVGYLIPDLKQFDFFFTIQDATNMFKTEIFCNMLSTTQQIVYMTPLLERKWHQTDLLRILDY